MAQQQKDFSSVSPSAKSLLLMKGYTSIPYARQVAALMQGPEVFDLSFDDKDFWFWIRVMHFESRYRSIDQLLRLAGCSNVLELSSGYSLRGLDLCVNDSGVHYIDTDLPEVIIVKQDMIDQLQLGKDLKGRFDLLPLNALDLAAFGSVTARFASGPLAVINEGLLMYLDTDEKKRLCSIIRNILKQRGGYWITADIYVKRSTEMQMSMPQSKGEQFFLQQHHVEENKFDSYEAASAFFTEQGFELVKEADVNYRDLSVMPHLIKVLPPDVRNSNEAPPKIQATWMLKAV